MTIMKATIVRTIGNITFGFLCLLAEMFGSDKAGVYSNACCTIGKDCSGHVRVCIVLDAHGEGGKEPWHR